MRRLADGVRRSGSALVLELGPLERDELTALLAARADGSAAGGRDGRDRRPLRGQPVLRRGAPRRRRRRSGELPRGLRDLLLQRVARLDRRDAGACCAWPRRPGATSRTRCCARLAELPERDVRESLRQAVEHGVLVADQASGSFRFRHALLAEAIYATILPGEREELHARLAEELARSGAASPAELAPHWAAAGRSAEALAASVEAARQAEAVFGLAEAHAHLERALALWPAVPDAAELAGLDLAELCAWTAELASQIGAAPARGRARAASDRARRRQRPARARRSSTSRLGRVPATRSAATTPRLAAFERAVELVPAEPPSPERAYALGVARRRIDGGLAPCGVAADRPSRRSRSRGRVGARRGGGPGAHRARRRPRLPRPRRGGPRAAPRRPCGSPRRSAIAWGLDRAYVNLTDALTMLGRPRESARLGQAGLEAMRRYGIDSTLLVANQIEALLAIGDWDEADTAQRRRAPRASPPSFPYLLLILRADLEIGRGDFDAARAHLEAARATLREDRGLGVYDGYLAELALWERRWTDADAAVQRRPGAGTRTARSAQIRVWLCAKGLRAQAELAALARARRDADAARRLARPRADELLAVARRAAAEASAVTPNAAGWLRPRRGRVRARRAASARPDSVVGAPRRPGSGSSARRSPPTAAGARPRRSSPPAPPAPRRACRSGRRTPSPPGSAPGRCCASSSCSPQRARLDLAPPDARSPSRSRLERAARPDAARGGGADARRPRLHQPRDRRRARDQRQDGQRPRLAHPAQARRAQPARGGRDVVARPPTGDGHLTAAL